MKPAPARLVMRGIQKRYGATRALAGVDLTLAPGEIHALVGENGAGKSSLMNVLAGVVAPDGGTMELDGEAYAPAGPLAARQRGLAMIHQELALAPHLSVAENVLLGAEPRCAGIRRWLVDRSALRARARAALAAVGKQDLPLERPLSALAPADRQRVEIARALAQDARVLVLDEPSSSLSESDVVALFEHLRALAARGVTLVYISHVLEEVFALCESYTVLRDGSSVAAGKLSDSTPERLVAAMVGRDVRALYPRSEARPGEIVLQLEAVAGRRLPRSASLALRRGEVLGIAGLIGAGRTELLRAVFGLDPVESGALRVLALEGARTCAERWRSGAGFLSEDRKLEGLAVRSTVAENLLLPSLARHARFGWLGAGALGRGAERWTRALGVRCASLEMPVGALSGGNQQKVALARLFAADADVLLLDEPTRGIDVGAKAEIYAWIDTLARQQNKAVLLVSSSLPELLGCADRIAVMCRGVLGPARATSELDQRRLMLAMTGQGAESGA